MRIVWSYQTRLSKESQKRIYNDIQGTSQKTKDRATTTPLERGELGCSSRLSSPSLVTYIVLLLNKNVMEMEIVLDTSISISK